MERRTLRQRHRPAGADLPHDATQDSDGGPDQPYVLELKRSGTTGRPGTRPISAPEPGVVNGTLNVTAVSAVGIAPSVPAGADHG